MTSVHSDLLAEAIALQHKGDFASAATLYQDFLMRDPLNTDTMYRLAQLSCQQGDLPGGIELVRRALQIDPAQARLHNLLGMALNALDKPLDALASFDRAIGLRPDLASAHGNRGDALAKLGRLQEAVAGYDRALALAPESIENLSNRAAALLELGRFDEALASYGRVLALAPDLADVHLSHAHILARVGKHHEALAGFEKALVCEPQRIDAILGRALALINLAVYDEALKTLDAALLLDPENVEALNGRAFVLNVLGQHAEALRLCDRVLTIDRAHVPALTNRGIALSAMRRNQEALASYQAVLELQPRDVEALYNVAYALHAINRFADALAAYDRLLEMRPDHVEALNGRGNALRALKRYREAQTSYDAALKIDRKHVDSMANRGMLFFALRQLDKALACYDEALAIRPDHVASHVGRGIVLLDRGLLHQALASFDRALAIDRDHVAALENRAVVLARMGSHDNALAIRKRVLAIDPHDGHAYSALLFSFLAACDWKQVAELTRDFKERLAHGRSVLEPFAALEYSDDPGDHLRCAQTFARTRFPQARRRLFRTGVQRERPLRLAYLSPDFRRHPVAYAIVSLLESHDRTRFEVIGASYGADDGSAIRARIVSAVDEFCDLSSKDDVEAARLLGELEVDIAIDLAGYTENSRPGILAERPAPVQVNYLGYSSTTAADFIDYVIADEFVLPFSDQGFFTEKIVHLPGCFLPTDGKRPPVRNPSSREDALLPETGFVFCSFNNSWKIRPPVFDIWMRLLGKTPGSVLWLAHNDENATTSLRREAQARGVDPMRLIFAPKVPSLEDHLARHQLADLFLDTLPYNAHSTAADALWAGLPVLTAAGRTFTGRVAASALHAVGLPELVANGLAQYEEIASRLANDPSALQSIRRKLAANRMTQPLFNSDRLRRNIEAAYIEMWDQYRSGENLRGFRVDSTGHEAN